MDRAEDEAASKPEPGQKLPMTRIMAEAARKLGTEEESEHLARRYALWARTLEILTESKFSSAQLDWQYCHGRAQYPRLVSRPLLRKPRLMPEVLSAPGGYGIVAKLWATLAALAKKFRSALRTPQAPQAARTGVRSRASDKGV